MATDKMEWHEIVNEAMMLLKGIKEQEREMAVAAIAAGCGMAVVKKPTSGGAFRPSPRRKI